MERIPHGWKFAARARRETVAECGITIPYKLQFVLFLRLTKCLYIYIYMLSVNTQTRGKCFKKLFQMMCLIN